MKMYQCNSVDEMLMIIDLLCDVGYQISPTIVNMIKFHNLFNTYKTLYVEDNYIYIVDASSRNNLREFSRHTGISFNYTTQPKGYFKHKFI